jgi:hypothetical protein
MRLIETQTLFSTVLICKLIWDLQNEWLFLHASVHTLLNFHCLRVTISYQISWRILPQSVPFRILVESTSRVDLAHTNTHTHVYTRVRAHTHTHTDMCAILRFLEYPVVKSLASMHAWMVCNHISLPSVSSQTHSITFPLEMFSIVKWRSSFVLSWPIYEVVVTFISLVDMDPLNTPSK